MGNRFPDTSPHPPDLFRSSLWGDLFGCVIFIYSFLNFISVVAVVLGGTEFFFNSKNTGQSLVGI